MIASGVKASAGATGTWTATLANASRKPWIVIAVAPGGTTVNGSFTADAIIKKLDIAGSFTANAIIRKTDIGQSFTADSIIKKLGIGQSFTADAIIRKTGIGQSFTADSIIRKTDIGQSFTADAAILKVQSGSFVADAYISLTTNQNFTADAIIRKTDIGQSFTADAIIRKLDIGQSFTADAYVKQTFGGGGPTYSAMVAADGAAAHWRLNETSGDTFEDSIGSLDGTKVGTITQGDPGPSQIADGAASNGGQQQRPAVRRLFSATVTRLLVNSSLFSLTMFRLWDSAPTTET
jgi:hypothetical protein